MRFDVNISGDQQVKRRIMRAGERSIDATPVFKILMRRFESRAVKQFDTQGRSGSGGWKPLAPSTVAAKRRAGGDRRILHMSRDLRKSLTTRGGGGHGLRIINKHQMIYGTTVPYAGFHQLGRGVPQRRPVEFTEAERRDDIKAIQLFIVRGKVVK